jgi:hypothetical protein
MLRLATLALLWFSSAGRLVASAAFEPAAVLGYVNALRAAHSAPSVAWDPVLAADAQAWATTLETTGVFQHSVSGGRYGENLGLTSSLGSGSGATSLPDAEWTSIVDTWYAEGAGYDYTVAFDPRALHFTQLIWKTTTSIGMGLATTVPAQSLPGQPQGRATYVVMRFAPAGNVIGTFLDNVLPLLPLLPAASSPAAKPMPMPMPMPMSPVPPPPAQKPMSMSPPPVPPPMSMSPAPPPPMPMSPAPPPPMPMSPAPALPQKPPPSPPAALPQKPVPPPSPAAAAKPMPMPMPMPMSPAPPAPALSQKPVPSPAPAAAPSPAPAPSPSPAPSPAASPSPANASTRPRAVFYITPNPPAPPRRMPPPSIFRVAPAPPGPPRPRAVFTVQPAPPHPPHPIIFHEVHPAIFHEVPPVIFHEVPPASPASARAFAV